MCYGNLRRKVTTKKTRVIVTFPDVSYRELTPFEEELEIKKYIRDNPIQRRPTNNELQTIKG